MTTNNHPAHGPVSLDRLHQISEILSNAAAQSDGGNLGYAMDRPENDTVSNMVPACIPCNLFKMCSTVEDFRSRIATQVDVTRRASRSYRTAESFGLVKQTNAPVVFWFERYQEGDNL